MIVGTEAATKGFSESAVAVAGDGAELFEIEGATHVDLYDIDRYVSQAVSKLADFFTESLSS